MDSPIKLASHPLLEQRELSSYQELLLKRISESYALASVFEFLP